MTGYEALKKAMIISGCFTEAYEDCLPAAVKIRGLELLNQILSDLKCEAAGALSDELALSKPKADALCYGTAMLLTLTEGDGGRNKLFADIYNSKRAAALSELGSISDRLPGVTAG